MSSTVEFGSFQEHDAATLPRLFIRAIQTVYPDLEDGVWTEGLHAIKATYIDTGGDFIVGKELDTVVAIGGIKRVNDSTGEIVRVAVEPSRQGEGLGQRVLEAMEARAKELGMTKLILDTTAQQRAAVRLYEKNHYIRVDRRQIDHPTGKRFDTYFYEKTLT